MSIYSVEFAFILYNTAERENCVFTPPLQYYQNDNLKMDRIAALSLYKSILRAHSSHLPPRMRQLGDAYVKSEFRLHKSVTKPEQLEAFFTEWRSYLDQIEFSARANDSISAGVLSSAGNAEQDRKPTQFSYGKVLPKDLDMNEDQIEKLNALKEEATKLGSK